MFTGIVEEIGEIKDISFSNSSGRLSIYSVKVLSGTKLGDSVSVCGVCLTVNQIYPTYFTVDVMPETLKATKLSLLKKGEPVNLERAMLLNGRLGGHILTGHIDGTGILTSIQNSGNAHILTIRSDNKILKYIIKKGSVALDGASLTVVGVDNTSFSVSLVPYTYINTSLSKLGIGSLINIEVDIIAKYVKKLMSNNYTEQNNLMNLL